MKSFQKTKETWSTSSEGVSRLIQIRGWPVMRQSDMSGSNLCWFKPKRRSQKGSKNWSWRRTKWIRTDSSMNSVYRPKTQLRTFTSKKRRSILNRVAKGYLPQTTCTLTSRGRVWRLKWNLSLRRRTPRRSRYLKLRRWASSRPRIWPWLRTSKRLKD